jgi:hypothetical protein
MGLRVVIGEPGIGMDNLIFLANTLQSSLGHQQKERLHGSFRIAAARC